MRTGNGRKVGWIICILGWILAGAVFVFALEVLVIVAALVR